MLHQRITNNFHPTIITALLGGVRDVLHEFWKFIVGDVLILLLHRRTAKVAGEVMGQGARDQGAS